LLKATTLIMKKYLLPSLIVISVIFFADGCKKSNGDTNKPFIIILGDNPVYTPLGGEYVDAGAEAWDVTEVGDTVDISNRLEVNSNVDINNEGDYQVKYDVSDEAGNNADEKIRTVKVVIGK
jgi:Bacterial surface protein, Ig-like domain